MYFFSHVLIVHITLNFFQRDKERKEAWTEKEEKKERKGGEKEGEKERLILLQPNANTFHSQRLLSVLIQVHPGLSPFHSFSPQVFIRPYHVAGTHCLGTEHAAVKLLQP